LRRIAHSCSFALAALGLISIQSARAGITWSSPTTISGDADVSTNGTTVYAYYMGGTGAAATTVNGVTFDSVGADPASSITLGQVTMSTTGGTVNNHPDIFGGMGNPPFSGLSSSYQTILGSDENTSAQTPELTLTVALGGLTSGNSYQVEFWVNDSRANITRSETVTGANTQTLSFNNTGGDGGVGQFVIGTFTASGTSQSFTITGTTGSEVSQINALDVLQTNVSSVPEPLSVILLIGMGAPMAVWASVRQRRAASTAGAGACAELRRSED
jgi:hypothetical protein